MARRVLFACVILLTAGACTKDATEEPITVTSTKLETLAFSSGALDPPFDPFIKQYSLASINSLTDITVIAKRFSPKASVKINSSDVTGESITMQFEKGKDLSISVTFRDSTEVYKISWVPPDFPKYTVNKSTTPANGFVYFAQLRSALPSCYAIMIDNQGVPVFYRKIQTTLLSDFKKSVTGTGRTRYSFQGNNPGIVQVAGGFQGSRVILDEKFGVRETIRTLTGTEDEPAPENHDFLLLDDNHYILSAYVLRRKVDLTSFGGGGSVDVVDLILQEVKNGSVVFEWRSGDYAEFFQNAEDQYKAQYGGPAPVDYFHFNSVCIDPSDGNLILSARHQSQVIKISRTTGEILWRLGGKSDQFNLPVAQKFSFQHHATRLDNGNLLLFDNGNSVGQTRILEFQINESAHTAALVWQYQEAGRFSNFMGSAQRLSNGNTLIGWGGAPDGTSQVDRSDITEVDPQGNVVFDLTFKNQPVNQFSYRAFRFE